jgi:hypothetical protein
MTCGSISEDSLTNISHRLFLSHYNALFNKKINSINNDTRHIIRHNKQLNELYDLFLDFIIDSSQHLDYHDAKKQEKLTKEN